LCCSGLSPDGCARAGTTQGAEIVVSTIQPVPRSAVLTATLGTGSEGTASLRLVRYQQPDQQNEHRGAT